MEWLEIVYSKNSRILLILNEYNQIFSPCYIGDLIKEYLLLASTSTPSPSPIRCWTIKRPERAKTWTRKKVKRFNISLLLCCLWIHFLLLLSFLIFFPFAGCSGAVNSIKWNARRSDRRCHRFTVWKAAGGASSLFFFYTYIFVASISCDMWRQIEVTYSEGGAKG